MLARRLAESVGSDTRDDERLRAEEEELRRRLEDGGLTASLPDELPDFVGSEHEVWSDGHKVLKATLPGAYGRRWGSRRFASPSEYLQRIHFAQTAFAFPWEVIGLCEEAGRVRIVTEQPFIAGQAPTHAEIDDFMEAIGFERGAHRFGDHWLRRTDSLLAFDAEPGNFVKTAAGLVPVDLILQCSDQ